MAEPSTGPLAIEGVRIPIPIDSVTAFCERWQITELALFGSVLRDDFGPESDVDVLVTFAEGAPWTLLDFVRMQNELGELLGREAHLTERRTVERSDNRYRREHILHNQRVIHVA